MAGGTASKRRESLGQNRFPQKKGVLQSIKMLKLILISVFILGVLFVCFVGIPFSVTQKGLLGEATFTYFANIFNASGSELKILIGILVAWALTCTGIYFPLKRLNSKRKTLVETDF